MAVCSIEIPLRDSTDDSYFHSVRKYVRSTKIDPIDLTDVLPSHVFRFLPSERRIVMKKFSLLILMENLVVNLRTQSVNLSNALWNRIIDLYDRHLVANDFENVAVKCTFQILFVAAKADVNELARCRQKSFDAHFGRILNQLESNISVAMATDEERVKIKTFLKLPIILTCFRLGFERLFGIDAFKDDWALDAIDEMQIYFANKLTSLNGVALLDGILMSNVFRNKCDTDTLKDAHTFTTACHETAHYLARLFSDDFNFSSPLLYPTANGQQRFRKDDVDGEKNFEFGRFVELTLFSGFQPAWVFSENRAAEAFISKCYSSDANLPLYELETWKDLGLEERSLPSLSFGCDVLLDLEDYID